ncbi:MAG: alpha/beta fold hydrolase, partial [Xanthomonadales bacterium]|nr:alpha/beta fold hydrolase [Xanthomonadales bacterium]
MAVELNHIEHPASGDETGPPLLIAHGLFGSARNFNTLGRRLAAGRRVVMVDMRNHGDSPWDKSNAYADMAADLAEAVDRLCGGRAVVLGHSMGGKAAMTMALSHPGRLAGLIVADIAPVPHEHTL